MSHDYSAIVAKLDGCTVLKTETHVSLDRTETVVPLVIQWGNRIYDLAWLDVLRNERRMLIIRLGDLNKATTNAKLRERHSCHARLRKLERQLEYYAPIRFALPKKL